jgi:hypothetical protein
MSDFWLAYNGINIRHIKLSLLSVNDMWLNVGQLPCYDRSYCLSLTCILLWIRWTMRNKAIFYQLCLVFNYICFVYGQISE